MEIIGEFQTTVRKALGEIDPGYLYYKGLVICGTHSPQIFDIDTVIEKIREARENKTPLLGICFGHQLVAIEYARNVLGIKDATSEEFGEGTHVVKKLPALNVGLRDGNTYWNNYEVAIDMDNPPWFFTTQAHPEYQSSIDRPHPLLVDFLKYAKLAM